METRWRGGGASFLRRGFGGGASPVRRLSSARVWRGAVHVGGLCSSADSARMVAVISPCGYGRSEHASEGDSASAWMRVVNCGLVQWEGTAVAMVGGGEAGCGCGLVARGVGVAAEA